MLFTKSASDSNAASTAILFKDFSKSTKDLLSKNFSAPGAWKVESKYKGPKDALYINPQVGTDGAMSVDVEYALSQHPVAVKLNLTPAFHDNAKLTMTCTNKGHKLETMLHKKQGSVVDYELVHEAANALKHVSMHGKVTKQAIEVGLGVEVVPKFHLGCGSVYKMKDHSCEWNLGCRWANKGYEAALLFNHQKTYTANVILPLSFDLNEKKLKAQVAAEAVYRAPTGALNYTAGISATCPVFPLNTIKAKLDQNLKWAIAYILKTEGSWAVSVSLDKNLRCGMLLTHS